jgi:hypothetical protein
MKCADCDSLQLNLDVTRSDLEFIRSNNTNLENENLLLRKMVLNQKESLSIASDLLEFFIQKEKDLSLKEKSQDLINRIKKLGEIDEQSI